MLTAKELRLIWESDCLGAAPFIDSLRTPAGFSAEALVTKLSVAGEGLIWQCVWGHACPVSHAFQPFAMVAPFLL